MMSYKLVVFQCLSLLPPHAGAVLMNGDNILRHNTDNMKKILICIVAAMIATISMAQERRGEQRQRREFNPEEMAMRQTNSLNEVLQLDSIQYQAIMLMNYADAITMQDSIKARRERQEKMRQEGKRPERTRPSEEQMKAMKELREQREQVRNEQMKAILTPEQFEKYLKYTQEQSKKMRQGGGQRGGNRMPRR